MPKSADAPRKQYLDNFGYERFSFEYGGYGFIGINSNALVCDTLPAYIDAAEQLEWMYGELKKYDHLKGTFVFAHHPPVLAKGSPVKHKSEWNERLPHTICAPHEAARREGHIRRTHPLRRNHRNRRHTRIHHRSLQLPPLRFPHRLPVSHHHPRRFIPPHPTINESKIIHTHTKQNPHGLLPAGIIVLLISALVILSPGSCLFLGPLR